MTKSFHDNAIRRVLPPRTKESQNSGLWRLKFNVEETGDLRDVLNSKWEDKRVMFAKTGANDDIVAANDAIEVDNIVDDNIEDSDDFNYDDPLVVDCLIRTGMKRVI
ncbi:hypothetical protein Salat_1100000 [Sesamum alatum]|uniref:Uncharacterized protein n=1 Tax=Sesamum alatum TaxID=300844 RepID=A0AAE1YNM7_9LAMI|nr:hypothetical protein Salat_1100000 [Sesamum alatum]